MGSSNLILFNGERACSSAERKSRWPPSSSSHFQLYSCPRASTAGTSLKFSAFFSEPISEACWSGEQALGVVSRSRIKIGHIFAKGKWSRGPHGSLRKPPRPVVLGEDEGGGGHEEGSPQEGRAHSATSSPGRRSFLSLPLLPALPEEHKCLHSLVGQHIGSRGLCWVKCKGPPGAWRPARMRPSPVFPLAFPSLAGFSRA